MPDNPLELEQQLCRELTARHAQYLQAATQIDALGAGASDPSESALLELQRIVGRLAESDERTSSLSRRWKQLGRPPGPALRQVLDRSETDLKRLIERVDAIEHAARDSRDRLAPQLDVHSRAVRMRDAYSRATGR